MKYGILALVLAFVTGCQPAIISSQIREADSLGSKRMLRCVGMDTGLFFSNAPDGKPELSRTYDSKREYQNVDSLNAGRQRSTLKSDLVLQEFDGWKMVYVSEYTTGNQLNTKGIMCFEKEYVVNEK